MLRATQRLWSTMARSPPHNPLIAIVGATGTGKSKLAVEIAKRYHGEIINGDAMQLYEGLPIITNKVTHEEQEGIPHHLLGCIKLHEQTWVVGTFVRNALAKIKEIRSRGRLPILVGGTHYYTQSLLFEDRLSEEEEKTEFVEKMEDKWPILKEDAEVLLEELKRVDPVMAERWHPKDRRKILRSLEIYLQTGKRASDIYTEQRESQDGFEATKMRFPTLLFWVHAEADALLTRLDERVDKMLEQGLLDEVKTLNAFAREQEAEGQPVDETRGIWVSIGYKEFKAYSRALQSETVDEKTLSKLKTEATERTQIATRQYAKRQIRWIRIKLVNALSQASPGEMYLLDASDVSSYTQTVVEPALALTRRFLQAEDMPEPSSLSSIAAEMLVPKRDYDLSAAPEKWAKHYCEACDVTCVTPEQWAQHTRSKTHKKRSSMAKRKLEKAVEVKPG